MTFTVKYRTNNGSIAEKAVEAANRADCFAKCKAQGIVPIAVESGSAVGGKGARGAGIGSKPKAPDSRLILAAVALVAIGAAVWLWPGAKKQEKAERESVQKVEKKKAPKQGKVFAPATNAVTKTEKPVKKAEKPEFEKKPGHLQLPDGKVLTFPPPKEGEKRLVHAYGHTYECDHLGNFKDITPRRLFHTAFEANFLGLAVEGGAFIPAFLTGLDEGDVKKMLLKKYEHIGDETEEEMAKLKAYDDMRCAALEYMEQGGKFDDFVNEFAQYEKQQRQSRALGLGEVMKLVKQGKMAEAKEMAEAANLLMEQKGFKPIRLPAHVQKAFDELPAAK